MASRKSFAPQVTAYWFTSSLMAAAAARLRSSGAGKSGNPCERLTAPYLRASRVISRMTDSVKRLAFSETWRCSLAAGVVIMSCLFRQKIEEISGQKRYDALTEGAGVATAARRVASLFARPPEGTILRRSSAFLDTPLKI